MQLEVPIREIMSTKVQVVSEDQDLRDAVALIRKHHIRHLPVVEGDRVVGMLSRTDINRLTFGALFENQDRADESILEMLTISHVMSSRPRTVSPQESLRTLAEIFSKEEYHALPVVENERLVGIVTTTDLIRYILEEGGQ